MKSVMQENSDLFIEVAKEQLGSDEYELFDSVEDLIVRWDQFYKRAFVSRSYIDFESYKQLCTHGRAAYGVFNRPSYSHITQVLDKYELQIFNSLSSEQPVLSLRREIFSSFHKYDKEEMEELLLTLATLIKVSSIKLKLLIATDVLVGEVYFILTTTQFDGVISNYEQSFETINN